MSPLHESRARAAAAARLEEMELALLRCADAIENRTLAVHPRRPRRREGREACHCCFVVQPPYDPAAGWRRVHLDGCVVLQLRALARLLCDAACALYATTWRTP